MRKVNGIDKKSFFFLHFHTSWNFKTIGLPPRLRESDVFLFRRSLSKGLPEVGFEIALNESFQKCQKWPKPKLITPYIKTRPLAVL